MDKKADNKACDAYFMALAIDLAKKGQYSTRPNPCVGCVIVKDTHVIGQGYHDRAGKAHAEIYALENARHNGHDPTGASVYVTLEPCCHYGRTPPCVNALITAGVGRVVVACTDPNPKVAGAGIALLRQAGIEVSVGVGYDDAYALNKGFFRAMMDNMPYVRLKIACSLDGRIALRDGTSKWITGDLARQDVQHWRALSGAIITGSQTIITDKPQLTVRLPEYHLPQPLLVVLDRSKRLSVHDDYLANQHHRPLWLIQDDTPLQQILAQLCRDRQIYDVLVESGATLASSFLQADLVDELIIYQAPCLLGQMARPLFLGDIHALSDRLNFRLVSHETIADDLKLVFIKNKA